MIGIVVDFEIETQLISKMELNFYFNFNFEGEILGIGEKFLILAI